MAQIFTARTAVPFADDANPAFRPPVLRLIQGGRPAGSAIRARKRQRAIRVLVAFGVAVALVVGSAVAFSVIDAPSQSPVRPSAARPTATRGPVIVVQSGDTLTSIARRLQPSGDVSGLVDRLAATHGPGALQPGDRIALGSLSPRG